MTTYLEARRIALKHYETTYASIEGGIVLLEDKTIETSYGWVFFCNTRVFLETRKLRTALLSNAPVLVEAKNGQVHSLGTSRSIEKTLQDFERQHGYTSK